MSFQVPDNKSLFWPAFVCTLLVSVSCLRLALGYDNGFSLEKDGTTLVTIFVTFLTATAVKASLAPEPKEVRNMVDTLKEVKEAVESPTDLSTLSPRLTESVNAAIKDADKKLSLP